MTPELLGFISNFMHLEEIDSTNLEAKRLVKQGHNENFVVIADSQTGGRGRGGNVWWSGKDSLTFTMSLGNLPELRIAEIPLVIGLAVQKVLQPILLGTEVMVKWPNDIMADSRKICGILCEVENGNDGNAKVLIGVGVNVNDSAEDVPDAIKNIYVSMHELLGRKLDKTQLFSDLLMAFKRHMETFCRRGFVHFMSDWDMCDFLKNRFVEVDKQKGYAVGVSERGRLRLLVDNDMREIISGTVNLL